MKHSAALLTILLCSAAFCAAPAAKVAPAPADDLRAAKALLEQAETDKDAAKVIPLLRKIISRNGDPEAILLLLNLAKEGVLTMPEKEMLALLEQAAAQKNGAALLNLGLFWEQKDPVKAAEYYRLALEAGQPQAGIRFGLCCHHGRGVPKDPDRAGDAFKADALRGIPKAQNLYGVMLVRKMDFVNGEQWIARAAKAGDLPAINNMGVFSRNGNTPESMAQSVVLFRKAAEGGYAPAIRNLAQAYWDGLGVKEDRQKAQTLAEQAAKAGDRTAYYLLGMMKLTDRKHAEAFPLYLKAAEMGYAPACLQVAIMYRQGIGMEKPDPVKADQWLKRQEELSGSAEEVPAK